MLKWGLAGLGAFAWIALWYERAPLLGIGQGILIGVVLVRELGPQLRGQ